jgi:hypothetical protein
MVSSVSNSSSIQCRVQNSLYNVTYFERSAHVHTNYKYALKNSLPLFLLFLLLLLVSCLTTYTHCSCSFELKALTALHSANNHTSTTICCAKHYANVSCFISSVLHTSLLIFSQFVLYDSLAYCHNTHGNRCFTSQSNSL